MMRLFQRKIIDRYIFREVSITWGAVITVLMSIMLSAYLAQFLGLAALGKFPQKLVFSVVGLTFLQYLKIVVPASFMIAIILSLGRLYRDNEISAIEASGQGAPALYRPLLSFAFLLAMLNGVLALEVSPWAGRTADYLRKEAREVVSVSAIESGSFQKLGKGKAVIYIESIGDDGLVLGSTFIRVEGDDNSSVITAKLGAVKQGQVGEKHSVVLLDGFRVESDEANTSHRITQFEEHGVNAKSPEFSYEVHKRIMMPMRDLLKSEDPQDIAEMHLRLGAPVMLFIILLFAVPMAHATPRQGRYAKLVWAILLYFTYANFLAMAPSWVASGDVGPIVGVWGVHFIFLVFGMVLLWRRYGNHGRPKPVLEDAPA